MLRVGVSRGFSRGTLIVTMLFALPFALIGTGMAFHTANTILSSISMRSWPTVPANLQQVELKQDGKSQRVVAAYSYEVNGQQYNGKRATLYSSDNLGNFHKNAFDELQSYSSRNAPYPAHVNPKDPNESILIPALRWEVIGFYMLFVILFGGIGWGILIASYLGRKRQKLESALAAQYPNEPWRHRLYWATGRLKSKEGSTALAIVFFAAVWSLVSTPLLFAVPGMVRDGQKMGLLLLLFPLIGIGLIYWAVVSVARAKRFGNTYLELETFPGRQGEGFRGRVLAPTALGEAESVKMTMSCERHYTVRGSDGKRETRTEVKWENHITAKPARGQSSSGDVAVKVSFPIPVGLPDSSNDSGEWYTWQIRGKASLKGADFEAEFEVPVFSRK